MNSFTIISIGCNGTKKNVINTLSHSLFGFDAMCRVLNNL